MDYKSLVFRFSCQGSDNMSHKGRLAHCCLIDDTGIWTRPLTYVAHVLIKINVLHYTEAHGFILCHNSGGTLQDPDS